MFSVVVTPPEPHEVVHKLQGRHRSSLSLTVTDLKSSVNEIGMSSAALKLATESDASLQIGHTARPGLSIEPRCTTVSPNSLTRSRPKPLALSSVLMKQSPPSLSPPPSPRTLNSPSYRHPTRLFPHSTQTDKRGFLLPPRANADLPATIDGKGDSFFIDQEALRMKEKERQRRNRRGYRNQTENNNDQVTMTIDTDASERDIWSDGDIVDEFVDVVDVDVEEYVEEPHWSQVIDQVLDLGHKLANKSKHRHYNHQHHQGPHVKTEERVLVEHVDD